MELVYIFHSCFVLSEADFLIVYDYWKDPNGRLKALLAEAEKEGKEVYFVISHFHEDHYNADIPQWCQEHPGWHLLPSYDTVRRRRIDKTLPLAVLRFGDVVETPFFRLHVYHSTDVGVSTVTLLRDGTTLYHAGDNNNWYFTDADNPDADRVKVSLEQMEKLFLSTLRDIKKDFPRIDHAMFPVDPRLEQEMLRGLFQLMKTIEVREVHPMHFCLPQEIMG